MMSRGVTSSASSYKRRGRPSRPSNTAQRAAVEVGAVEVQEVAQLAQQGAEAAGGVEVLHVTIAGRLQVHQHGGFFGQMVEAAEVHRHARAAGDGGQVDE